MYELLQFFKGLSLAQWVILYWIPLGVCLLYYVKRSFKEIKADHDRRDRAEEGKFHYEPNVTVGLLVGYLVLTVFPVVNLIIAFFITIGMWLLHALGFIADILYKPIIARRT